MAPAWAQGIFVGSKLRPCATGEKTPIPLSSWSPCRLLAENVHVFSLGVNGAKLCGSTIVELCGLFFLILLMVQKSQTTTWDVFEPPMNNGINYQPQLVSLPDFFQPSTSTTERCGVFFFTLAISSGKKHKGYFSQGGRMFPTKLPETGDILGAETTKNNQFSDRNKQPASCWAVKEFWLSN